MNPLANLLPEAIHFIHLEGSQLAFILGLMLFFGTCGGYLFQKLKIPQVVGYFIIGIILGNSGFQILRPEAVALLNPISQISLAFIGFLVGGELKAATIKKYGKQFTSILLFESLTPALIVGVITGFVEFFFTHDVYKSVAVGLLFGAICSSTAPEATTNVLQEYRTRGPLTTMIYGMVAMDDAVALILYAVASTIAGPLLGGHPEPLGIQLLHIAYDIFGSIAFGLALGALITLIIRKLMNNEGLVLSFMLGTLLLSTGITSLIHLDNILAAMAVGCYVANFAPKSVQNIFKITNKFTPPIYVLFFVTVGAKLNIWGMKIMLLLMVLGYIFGRTFGKALGSWFGAKITNAPKTVQKYMKFTLLSQAGVAIGLSLQAGNDFSDTVGNNILLVVTATTFIAELIGPVFVKYGVSKAGECGLDIQIDDIMKKCTVGDVTLAGKLICDKNSTSIVAENECLSKILASFSKNHNQNYAVKTKDGKFAGIITLKHLKEALSFSEFSEGVLAMDIMEDCPIVINPKMGIPELMETFSENDIDALPIVSSDNQLLGIAERSVVEHYLHAKIVEVQGKLASLDS
ncbi:MAG: cation:proton antiporter [Treponemataceae bacterium]|nr:cation:proton antiporter [Treponemataceae bacterium]